MSRSLLEYPVYSDNYDLLLSIKLPEDSSRVEVPAFQPAVAPGQQLCEAQFGTKGNLLKPEFGKERGVSAVRNGATRGIYVNSLTKVYFVGAGPGDADLITVKGAHLLREADVIVYAGSLVDRELVKKYSAAARVYDSAGMTLEETTTILAQAALGGEKAVRLHTGDPSISVAIHEQMEALDKLGVEYEVVPGVTSAFAAAAALKQELTLPEVSQTVVITRLAGRTPVPEREQLRKIAEIGATAVIYLSVSMIDDVVSELLLGAYTVETPAAVVAKASWPDEEIIEGALGDIAAKVKEAGITKQALIIVGDVLAARRDGMRAKSQLYDKGFSHGCRKGIIT